MKRSRIILLLSIIVVFIVTGCGKKQETVASGTSEDQVIRLAGPSSKTTLSLAAGIAQNQKYFEEELGKIGYSIEYVGFAGAGPAVNEALLSHNIEFATYGDLPATMLDANSGNTKIIGISSSQNNLSMIASKESGIKSGADLEGKKVVLAIGTVYHHFFEELVKYYGLDESKITVINSPADGATIFADGEADAYIIDDIYIRNIEKQGLGTTVETSVNHPEWSCQIVLVGREDYIEAHPEVATAVVKAYIRAYRFAAENPNEAYNILTYGGDYDLDLVESVYGFDGGKFEFFNTQITESSKQKLQLLSDFLVENKLTAKDVNLNDFVDTSYYDKAMEELGKEK